MITPDQARERLGHLAESLERDIALAQTRDQHLRLAQRLADVRALVADLAA